MHKTKMAILHFFLLHGDRESAELLINKGAALDLQNNKGYTVLHMAVSAGNQKIAQLIIEKGGSKNIRDSQGRTPLCIAKSRNTDGSYNAIIALLSK